MPLHEDIGRGARKLFLPAVASVAGAGAGLVLTRKSVRTAIPDLGDLGIGDLADDLRKKLDSVIGKGHSPARLGQGSGSSQRRIDSRELHQRLREREQRRSRRRARS
jgi:hypothetical protein